VTHPLPETVPYFWLTELLYAAKELDDRGCHRDCEAFGDGHIDDYDGDRCSCGFVRFYRLLGETTARVNPLERAREKGEVHPLEGCGSVEQFHLELARAIATPGTEGWTLEALRTEKGRAEVLDHVRRLAGAPGNATPDVDALEWFSADTLDDMNASGLYVIATDVHAVTSEGERRETKTAWWNGEFLDGDDLEEAYDNVRWVYGPVEAPPMEAPHG
jgi:hypothetical protein